MKVIYDEALKRYIVIDEKTGEVIDDAQGYGFRTKEGAYKCVSYKKYFNRKLDEAKLIVDWWNEHKSLVKRINRRLFVDPSFLDCEDSLEDHERILNEYLESVKDEFNDAPYPMYKMLKDKDEAYKIVKKKKLK